MGPYLQPSCPQHVWQDQRSKAQLSAYQEIKLSVAREILVDQIAAPLRGTCLKPYRESYHRSSLPEMRYLGESSYICRLPTWTQVQNPYHMYVFPSLVHEWYHNCHGVDRSPSTGDPRNPTATNKSQWAPIVPKEATMVSNGGLRVAGLICTDGS